jgi:hypothetical protein
MALKSLLILAQLGLVASLAPGEPLGEFTGKDGDFTLVFTGDDEIGFFPVKKGGFSKKMESFYWSGHD